MGACIVVYQIQPSVRNQTLGRGVCAHGSARVHLVQGVMPKRGVLKL